MFASEHWYKLSQMINIVLKFGVLTIKYEMFHFATQGPQTSEMRHCDTNLKRIFLISYIIVLYKHLYWSMSCPHNVLSPSHIRAIRKIVYV